MDFKQPGLCCISVMLMLGMAWASHASPEIIVPRLSEIPVVDGRLDENAWQIAVELSVGARVGFDDVALWLALSNLPRRNVLEITLRVTDCMEEQDYFTVDADGKKQLVRQRRRPPLAPPAEPVQVAAQDLLVVGIGTAARRVVLGCPEA